ncbi:unnamed protein product [Prunus armeniaca]
MDMLGELARGFIKVMEDTLKQMREKFKRMIKRKSLSNKRFMKEKLINLLKVDVVDSTKDEALMLLASLPLSYEHFQKTMMIGKSTLNFEEVVQDLVHHGLP